VLADRKVVEKEGEEGRSRARAAREAPRFLALLVSIRVLTHGVMTVAWVRG
jgi:hypothetical protein